MTTVRARIGELFADDDKVMLIEPDSFDAAIVGIATRFGVHSPMVAYDRRKCIEILMAEGMDEEGAEEYFEFNIIGAWVGEGTPVFIDTSVADQPGTS